MTAALVLTNARLVLDDSIVLGSVCVGDDGRISQLDSGVAHSVVGAIDCENDFVVPGLIELHTDNYERHLTPRPAVRWPAAQAILGHDAEVAAAGITTVFDAIACGDYDTGGTRAQVMREALAAVDEAVHSGYLRADHLLHLRCETSDSYVVEAFDSLSGNPRLGLVSLMDHTPGQRQWSDIEKYKVFYAGRSGKPIDEFSQIVDQRVAQGKEFAEKNRSALVERVSALGVPLANHDDTTLEHVIEGAADGVKISEFPTTELAARAAIDRGMITVMGAPNVVRGGSHSGNASARDLAQAGLVHALSSDYVPRSLMQAAFLLHTEAGISLPAAIAMVTSAPAACVGLLDRGRIAVGLRGDFARVRVTAGGPVVLASWKAGERIA